MEKAKTCEFECYKLANVAKIFRAAPTGGSFHTVQKMPISGVFSGKRSEAKNPEIGIPVHPWNMSDPKQGYAGLGIG